MRPRRRRELVADVVPGGEVDDPVAGADRGAHDGEAPPVVGRDLEVGAGSPAAEGAEQLAGEALPLEPADARHDRQLRVEPDGDRVRAGLEDEAGAAHPGPHRRRGGALSRDLGSPAGRARVTWRPASAPLAQSAERFHGKEKVVSSILTGGSHHDPGGVAQLVRALGS